MPNKSNTLGKAHKQRQHVRLHNRIPTIFSNAASSSTKHYRNVKNAMRARILHVRHLLTTGCLLSDSTCEARCTLYRLFNYAPRLTKETAQRISPFSKDNVADKVSYAFVSPLALFTAGLRGGIFLPNTRALNLAGIAHYEAERASQLLVIFRDIFRWSLRKCLSALKRDWQVRRQRYADDTRDYNANVVLPNSTAETEQILALLSILSPNAGPHCAPTRRCFFNLFEDASETPTPLSYPICNVST